MTYHFDPTKGDPRLKLVDQHILITPIYSDQYAETTAASVKDKPEDKMTVDLLKDKYRNEVNAALQVMVDTGTISDDLWKTPLRPNCDFKTLKPSEN